METQTGFQVVTRISGGTGPWPFMSLARDTASRATRFFRIAMWALLIVCITAGIAAAERMAVKVPKANIRFGPGTEHEVRWKVEQYYPIEIIRKTESWYYFKDFEGDTGWIHKSLVGSIATVITIKNKCNIRSGPGTDFEIVLTAEKGVCFRVLEKKGKWIHIEHVDGHNGWIFHTLVW